MQPRSSKIFHFVPLNLPPASLQLRPGKDGRTDVYDTLRHRWLVLTDEEWVRQNFTAWMRDALGYPASLMANEVGLTLNRTRRRVDTLVYDRRARPLLVVEFKAPSVDITQAVFDQAVRYDLVLQAPLIAVSNGLRHYCCAVDTTTASWRYLPSFPTYHEAIALSYRH